MLKRTLAMLMVIVTVLGLLPLNVIAESTAQKNTAYTAPLTQHAHAASGDAHICEHCVAAGKTGDAAKPNWQALTGTALPTTSGHYYLTGDITVSSKDLKNADVVLCLNGYTVTAASGKRFYSMKQDGKFTVLDCTAKTVTPENQDDTGYRAGKMVVSTDYGFMFSNDSGNNAVLTWYDGILTGGRKAATGGLMSIQQSADVYFYGGEVRDNNTGTGTANGPIYLAGGSNTFHAENTAFIGNRSAAKGGVFTAAGAAVVELENCLFKDNSAVTSGGVFNGDNGLKVTARNCTFTNNDAATSGGVFSGKGGWFKAYGCTITGSDSKDYSAIAGVGGGVQVLLDSCRITENTATGNSGVVFVPNSSTPLTLSGNTYIYGNTRKDGVQGNIHLQSDNNGNYPVVTVSGLTAGAKIGINVNSVRLEASKVLSKALGGALTRAQVIEYFYSDDTAYMIDLADDKLVLAQGHVHTSHLTTCADQNCTGHDNVLYLPWTDPNSLPTSGNYYLDTDVETKAKVVMTTGTLNLCLNGKTITATNRFEISGDAKLNITDCSAKTVDDVYTAGKITGATNGVFQMNGDTDSSGKKCYVNIYEGIITENSRTKDHAAVAFIEKKATFNLYGGEISGNTVGATSSGRGGVIYLQDNTVTFNMFGGKITGNTAVKNGTYGGNGGAIFSRDRGIINILGGEISGNIAHTDGGAIWAKGGSVTVKNAKITGNEAKGASGAIYGAGSSVQIILENAELTGNKSAKYGAIYTPNNGSKIIVSGTTKIIGNQGGNVCLVKDTNDSSPDHSMITLGAAGLSSGAKIGITMPDARLSAEPHASLALGSKLTEDQVAEYFYADNTDYEVVLKDDRLLLQQQGAGHKHCVCGVEGCTDHAQILCKPWSDPDSLPTSGSYYLETDVTTKTQPVLTTGTLNLCLNGKTITIKERFAISGDAVLNITDCQATPGKITGSGSCVFYMTGDTTGKKSFVNIYDGIVTGNHRTNFHAAVAYIQSGATLNMYGGEISGNSVKANSSEDKGGIIYINNNTGTFNMYGGKITGNTVHANSNNTAKGGHGTIYSNGGTVNIQGGEISGNTVASAGGAIWAKGGTVTVKNAKITGNRANSASAIYGAGGGVQITLDSAQITGNQATAAGITYGAIYIPNNGAKITVKGTVKIADNEGGNLYLTKDSNASNPNHPMITVSGLTAGAKIGITMPADRMAAQPYASAVLNGALTDAQVAEYFFCDNERYEVTRKDDRLHIAKFYLDIGHKHCACNDSVGSCDHKSINWIAWDDPTSLPTSGNYCLTVDVKTSQNVSITGSDVLNLCLNGHTIEAGGSQEGTWRDRIFDIKENATLNLTDCTGKGKLTGGTYGVILFENNEASTGVLNMYGGNIVGNKSISLGGAVLLQGGGTFNMYGGEISGNSMNGKLLVDANGNPVLDEKGNQQTEGTNNGGGAIGLMGAKTTFNMYGGKITDNECLPTQYKQADGTTGTVAGRGGAIYTNRGTVNIYGGEISRNRAGQGGGIYAVIYSTINVTGGEIRENITTGHGGGIFADNCYVTIAGGKITKNDSGQVGSGGGIQVSNGKGFLKITGGEITENKGYYGGGIMCQGRCPITIEDGLIARNSADTAGGVYISTLSPAKMTGGTITENTAKNNAGGLYILRNTLDFTGGEITNNTAGNEAGGMFVYGATLNMDGGIIKGNTGKSGGGLSCGRLSANVDGVMTEFRPTINLISGSIEHNSAQGAGGGMLTQGYATVNIKGGSLKNNSAKGNGGGAYISKNCTLVMTDGTVSGNAADGTGGGMYVLNATADFAGGVFEKNTTKKQGAGICASHSEIKLSGVKLRNHNHKGVGAAYTGFNAKTTMTAGSITGNYADSYGAAAYLQRGTFYMYGGSISGNSTKGNAAGIYVAGVKLYVYGGSFYNNKCEGSGGAAIFTSRWNYTENGVKKEDKPFVEIHGGTFSGNYGRNGGALLIQSSATLKITGGTFTKNEGPSSGGALFVSTNCKYEITGGTFTENKTEVDGGAINLLNAQGVMDGASGKLIIENNYAKRYGGGINITGEHTDATVKNLTVSSNSVSNRGGGVAVNTKAHANFENVEICNNHSQIQGGGFYVGHAPVVTMKDSHIHHNTSEAAGAGIATETVNEVTLENVVISENETKTKAGGIYTRAAKMHLIGCEVKNNVAGGDGGGIATGQLFGRGGEIGSGGKQDGLILENTKVTGNTCVGAGGGIHLNNGNYATITNSEVSGNTAGTEGSGIWTRENLKAVDMTITGNISQTNGYALFIADAEYDGQSFVQAVLEMGGNIIVKDNTGGEVYMGANNAIATVAEGFGKDTFFNITLDSGVLTSRLLGAYHYERGEDGIYTVTYGTRSMTEPEAYAQPDADGSNTLLYIGVGAFAVLLAAAAVVLILLKKKKNQTPAAPAAEE